MTRTEALKIAKRLLGKSIYWEERDNGPRDQEEHDTRRAAYDQAKADADAAKLARQDRHTALLAADTEYQRLRQAEKEAVSKREAASRSLWHRVEIGTADNAYGFRMLSPKAYGFNWADAIRKLEAEAARKQTGGSR